MKPLATAGAALVLVLSAPSCGQQDVVVASPADPFDSGSDREASGAPDSDASPEDAVTDRVNTGDDTRVPEEEGGPWCSNDEDCPGAFCAKGSCDAPHGRCQVPRPACDDGYAPVCGCDGVTYWNDCLRQKNSVSARTMGPCSARFVVCEADAGNSPCPAQASCARLETGFSGPCDPNSPGVCWVLPETCPEDAGTPQWNRCTGGAGAPSCTDQCTAIRSGAPYEPSNGSCVRERPLMEAGD
jgi:hypothetical protein